MKLGHDHRKENIPSKKIVLSELCLKHGGLRGGIKPHSEHCSGTGECVCVCSVFNFHEFFSIAFDNLGPLRR